PAGRREEAVDHRRVLLGLACDIRLEPLAFLSRSLFHFVMSRCAARAPLVPYPALFRSTSACTATARPPARSTRATVSARSSGAADRKSTRLNSSHVSISYAVFCLKKKTGGRPRDSARTARATSARDRSRSALSLRVPRA